METKEHPSFASEEEGWMIEEEGALCVLLSRLISVHVATRDIWHKHISPIYEIGTNNIHAHILQARCC